MNNKPIIISGTGCALADYLYTSARFDHPLFSQYLSKKTGDGGLCPGKLVFTEELEMFANKLYPEILKDISENRNPDSFNIGGPGLVSLIHASQMLDDSGFEVRFFGNAGHDQTANRIFNLLRKTRLNIDHYQQFGNKATAFTDVFSDPTFDGGNGERTFVNNIGAAWDYSPEMLSDDFFSSDIVCFGGTALVPQLHDNLTFLLKKARLNACITIVNTVYDFRNEKNAPEKPWPLGNSDENFPLIDLLIMDREEALRISGQNSVEEASIYFKEKNVASFVITNGGNDLLALSNGRFFKAMDITAFPVSTRVTNEVRKQGDTTGCGDNFAGGLIAAVAEQIRSDKNSPKSFTEALSWAVASGGHACSYVGGTYFETYLGEKRKLIEDYQSAYLEQIGKDYLG